MSKSVSNSPSSGQSDGAKLAEPLSQSGKGNENKSLGQSGRGKRKETKLCIRMRKVAKATGKRHPEKRKEGKVGLGHQAKNQRRKPRKVESIEIVWWPCRMTLIWSPCGLFLHFLLICLNGSQLGKIFYDHLKMR